MEYVARHTPGGGMVTGDIGKSLGDGNGFPRRCSRCLKVGFVVGGERSAVATFESSFNVACLERPPPTVVTSGASSPRLERSVYVENTSHFAVEQLDVYTRRLTSRG